MKVISQSWTDDASAAATEAADIISKLDAAVALYRENTAKIDKDSRLSAQGKEQDRAMAATNTRDDLRRIANSFLSRADKQIADLEATLRNPATGADDVVSYLRRREYRDLLRAKDPLEVMALYIELSTSGGADDVMLAIEEFASTPFPLWEDTELADTIAAGKAARAVRNSPQTATALQSMRRARLNVEIQLASSIGALKLPDDTLERIARDGTAATAA